MPSLPFDETRYRKQHWAAENLAARLLARPWTLAAIDGAVGETLAGVAARTRAALTVRLFALGEDTYPPAARDIVDHLMRSRFFNPKPGLTVAAVLDAPVFAPLPRFAGLAIPALATQAELAAWLGLTAEELDWFADQRNGQCHARSAKLLHYHHQLAPKTGGGARLLEAPKARLKAIQRRILREILVAVPVHGSAHGFVAGRSCLTGARLHAGEAVVVRFDLWSFFPSIVAARVHGVFRSLGYPWPVARLLTGLCTAATPPGIIDRLAGGQQDGLALREMYGSRHLPQGAPSSPALANLLAWRLDARLQGLARAAQANYARYADDLIFSGNADFASSAGRFGRAVLAIVEAEGFRLNQGKTRVMPRHTRQSVTGVVVNAHCNVGRAAFDTLKAILHHCVITGPQGQNRAGVADFRRVLQGKIAWVAQVNPRRGERLWRLFDQIDWDS